MSNIVGLDLNINQEYIAASVQDIVKAAIIQALGNEGEIVRKAIDSTIDCYVTDDGKKCGKNDWRAKPFLDWLAQKTVEDTVRECVKEIVEENKDTFKAEIKKQLSSRKWKENVAEAFLGAILDAGKSMYRMPITLTFQQNGEDD